MKQLSIILLLSAHSLFVKAPASRQPLNIDLPKGYFRNPLGIPIQLAANFGELRSNHFHMGLDIRTNQRENLPVYAAAEGYISRVKIERYGFGRAIYINHPNGFTTLYAHLNDFYPGLNNHVIEKQYADQQWEQDIELEPGKFPVSKGQFIAFSGNTGGSAGPHLHFEIRDTKTGNNLNPWLFDFGLPDNIKPLIYRLYYYDRRYSTYETTPVNVPITGANGKYIGPAILHLNTPYLSFGISAEDKTTPSSFKFGIYEATINIDGSLHSAFQINNFSYNDTRYVNATIDYRTRFTGGPYIQHLSQLPGNDLAIFSGGDGTLLLTDTLIHRAEVVVKDVEGNISVVTFRFKWDGNVATRKTSSPNGIQMVPGKETKIETSDFQAIFSGKAFYDTVPFIYRTVPSADPKIVSSIQYLHNNTIPVHDSFTVRIKPSKPLNSETEKMLVQLSNGRKTEVVKGQWAGEWIEAKFRDLGTVKLMIDNIPPRITNIGWSNGGTVRSKKSISLAVNDNSGEIKSFNAYMDGNWLLFSRKSNYFIHSFDQRTGRGKHELKVVVEDLAGNVTEKMYSLTR